MVVALLFVLTPIIVDLTTAVMVDIALAALALEASWWLARYYVSGETRHVLLFGLFATCCCLTKGNGVAITLLPGILMLATGRVHLLRTRGLYMSAAMVAVFTGPFSASVIGSATRWVTSPARAPRTCRAFGFTRFLWRELTPVPLRARDAGRRARSGARTGPPALHTIVRPPSSRSRRPSSSSTPSAARYSSRYVAAAVALLGLVPLGPPS